MIFATQILNGKFFSPVRTSKFKPEGTFLQPAQSAVWTAKGIETKLQYSVIKKYFSLNLIDKIKYFLINQLWAKVDT